MIARSAIHLVFHGVTVAKGAHYIITSAARLIVYMVMLTLRCVMNLIIAIGAPLLIWWNYWRQFYRLIRANYGKNNY